MNQSSDSSIRGRVPLAGVETEARLLRSTATEVHVMDRERAYGKSTGKKPEALRPMALRMKKFGIPPEDDDYLKDLALATGHSEAYLHRVAVRMFTNAHRRNPNILKGGE